VEKETDLSIIISKFGSEQDKESSRCSKYHLSNLINLIFVSEALEDVDFSEEKEVRMTCLILLTREILATYNNE